MILKNNLKEIRQKNGFTQEELGTNVGVSRQTIISIERYRYKPTLELAMKIAQKLNIKIEKLYVNFSFKYFIFSKYHHICKTDCLFLLYLDSLYKKKSIL